MKNTPNKFIVVLFLFVNSISAQKQTKPDFEIKKEKLFQSISKSFQELKEGYSFSECSNCEENARTLDGESYALLNAVSFAEIERPEIFNREERAILGYMKGKDKSLVLVSVHKFIDDGGTISYSKPELMLYNSNGYKIAQLDFGSISIENSEVNSRALAQKKGFPNFRIKNGCFVRDYSFFEIVETKVYDENTFEEKTENKKINVDEYFNISFNENGFIIDLRDGTQLTLRNNFLSSSYRKYTGEINYSNGSHYQGTFLMSNDFKPQPSDLGEFKNKNGEIKKGRFCLDTVLCNFPKFFLGSENLGDPRTEYEQERKLSLKKLSSAQGLSTESDGIIVSTEFLIVTNDPQKVIVYSTSGGNFPTELKKKIKELPKNSKLFIDVKYRYNSTGRLAMFAYSHVLE